ncbi:hypothetical protein XI00_05980 [Bradyrhizobium sp. CCBAU 21359]|nr:hypothetical protein [Bradyrhizobium sp. CCBAU 21359]
MPTGELGELFPHVDMKIIDQGTAQRLPHLKSLLDTLAIDGTLDPEQCIDPPHDLDRDRRERDCLLAGCVAPGIL